MPGCIVSATTASFRSVEKRRLRATPVITSTLENVSDIGICLGLSLGPPASADVRSKRGALQLYAKRCLRDLRSAEEAARARHSVGEDGSRPVLPDQRKPIGCTMSTGEDFGTALAGLTRASRARLAEHWAEYFGAAPPPRTSRPLMIRAVAYKMQERA